jgi:hypothetical protein
MSAVALALMVFPDGDEADYGRTIASGIDACGTDGFIVE